MHSPKLISLTAAAVIALAGVVFWDDLAKQAKWTINRDACEDPPQVHGWHRPASQPAQAGYDALQHIEGYELYADHFISAGTPEEVAERKRQIVCRYGLATQRLQDSNETLAERQARQPRTAAESRVDDAKRKFLDGMIQRSVD